MAKFNYDKTYGPFDGATIVEHDEGAVEVPAGAVLNFEVRHIPVVTPYVKKKTTAKKKEPKK